MKFIATIENGANMEKLVAELKKLGFTIDRIRTFSRNISGQSDSRTLDDLRKVKGIRFAEEERNIYKA